MRRPIICLAPMDGITDSAYRRIVRRFNREVVLFSEFTSADGFLRSQRVRGRLDYTAEEHPYFVQLFGNNPDSFAEVARALEQQGVAGVDINMGCPDKKIVHSQHGSGLMRDVDKACRVVEAVAVVEAVPDVVEPLLRVAGRPMEPVCGLTVRHADRTRGTEICRPGEPSAAPRKRETRQRHNQEHTH